MRRGTWILVAAACATVLGILIGFHAGSAQDVKGKKPSATPIPYNPYPPGILPADLQSELDRVGREVNLIFQQALAEFRALPPPNLTGQPPTLQGSGVQMEHPDAQYRIGVNPRYYDGDRYQQGRDGEPPVHLLRLGQ